VAETLDIREPGDEISIGLQKLAFEVMYRIGRVTPVTPTALLAIVLLAAAGDRRTAPEISGECRRLLEYMGERAIPTTREAQLSGPEDVAAHLEGLAEHGNVSSNESEGRRFFWLDDEQRLRMSYYRNTVVHFFVVGALAEMASRTGRDAVVEEALELRDLVKFEFFFPEKTEFAEEIDIETSRESPRLAHWAILPILDAYGVVADELVSWRGDFEEKRFLRRCLARARLYRAEARIHGESVSQPLFVSALALARNRDLVEETPEVEALRVEFAAEVERARDLASA
jgi:glycerol-3-phosphate O-acyltransferase